MSYDDSEKLPSLPPAPMNARVAAGAFDLAVLGVLMALYFFLPLFLGGLTVPMWGVFAAIVGYSVIPLALFKATLGMRLFGIEAVSVKTGKSAPVTDLVFRELIGRGFFPIAYLGILVFGLIAAYFGRIGFAMPGGFGKLVFYLSIVLLAAAFIGQFLVFSRPDRRSLADLMARTIITPRRGEAPLPDDEDLRADELRARSARGRNFVIAEIIVLAIGIGLPYLLTRSTPGESTFSQADRITRKKLAVQFEQDKSNSKVASDLYWALMEAGEPEEAKRVNDEHQKAKAEKEAQRQAANRERQAKQEAELRSRLAANPKDEESTWALIELLEESGRTEDARAAYKALVDADPTMERHATYGVWLYQSDFNEEAVAELTTAVNGGLKDDAEIYAYRGFAYRDLNDFKRAREDFKKALKLDPTLDSIADALEALDELEQQAKQTP